MNKKGKAVKENFENILGESLRFHGLLTKSQDSKSNLSLKSGELPDHLKTADFLFKKKITQQEQDTLPQMKIAALKKRK